MGGGLHFGDPDHLVVRAGPAEKMGGGLHFGDPDHLVVRAADDAEGGLHFGDPDHLVVRAGPAERSGGALRESAGAFSENPRYFTQFPALFCTKKSPKYES